MAKKNFIKEISKHTHTHISLPFRKMVVNIKLQSVSLLLQRDSRNNLSTEQACCGDSHSDISFLQGLLVQ